MLIFQWKLQLRAIAILCPFLHKKNWIILPLLLLLTCCFSPAVSHLEKQMGASWSHLRNVPLFNVQCSTTPLPQHCMCTLFLFVRYPEISWVRSFPLALCTLFFFLRYPERILFTLQSLAAPHLDWKVREVNSSWKCPDPMQSLKVGKWASCIFHFQGHFSQIHHHQSLHFLPSSFYALTLNINCWCNKINIARGTTDPEIDSVTLNLNLVTTWHRLH